MNTSFFSSFPFLGSFAPTCEHSISMMMVLLISIYYIPSTARQVFQDLPLYKRIRWITVWAVPIHANSIWYLVFLKRHARDTWRSIHAIVLQIRCDGYACPDDYKDNCKNRCCNCDSCESRYHLFGPNFAECLADIQVVPYTLDTIIAFLLDLELPHYINSCLRLTIFINSDALGTRNSAEMAVSIALARVSNEIKFRSALFSFCPYLYTYRQGTQLDVGTEPQRLESTCPLWSLISSVHPCQPGSVVSAWADPAGPTVKWPYLPLLLL